MAMKTRISKFFGISTTEQASVFESKSVFDSSLYWHLVPEEIGKGPYEMSLYISVLKDGSVPDRSVRVHIVGNYAQGKTSLVKRLVKAKTKGTKSTDGIDIHRLRSADLFLQAREPEIQSESGDKSATFSEESMFEGGDTSINYDLWDFGGQYVFYATHALFHSNRAIYVLVMDLTKKFDTIVRDTSHPNETGNRNVEYFIKFWMNSIHSFAGSLEGFEPPVILVGTHIDKVRGFRRRSKLRRAEIYFEDVRRLFDGTQILNHFHKKDFAVNNRKRHDIVIDVLREEIMDIGRSKARTVEIPTRWVDLDHKLKYVTQKVITIGKIQTLVSENDFQTMPVGELKLFLQYQHAKGTLFYFDRDPIAEYVVLDPQYLIDAFKCIITSERFCRKDPTIRPLWQKLISTGRLDMELIVNVWGGKEGFIDDKDILLEYLKSHHIISEAKQYDEDIDKACGLGWFIVPSLLKVHRTQSELNDYLTDKVPVQVRFVLCFEFSSVVQLLFHRLVAAALARWSIADSLEGDLMMYENLIIFRLNINHIGIIEINHNLIELTAFNLCPDRKIEGHIVDSFRRFVENVISREFVALQFSDEQKRTMYTSYYRCNHACHSLNGSKHLQNISHLTKNTICPCPDSLAHEIDTSTARSEWFQENKISGCNSNKVLTDKELSRIAQAIGMNWQFLGLELGLTSVQIDHISEDNAHSVAMRIYKMLLQWKSRDTINATMNNFVKVLQTCSNVNVEWDEIRNIVDDLNMEIE